MGCGMGARTSGANQDQEKKVAVTIGDSPLYAEDLSKMIEANRQRALQGVTEGGPDALPPAQEAYVQGQTINQALEGVGFTYLAKKAGATFTDEAIKKAEMATFEQEVIQTKFALQSQKMLKPGATDKDFDEVLKKQAGGTVAELKKKFNDNVEQNLKDPKIRPTLESTVARQVLTDALQAKTKPSDAEVKASYDNYVFKRILFSMDPTDSTSQIQKAEADLKGGLTFEQAMDRYSKEPASQKGKKVSDNTTELNAPQFEAIPDYSSLKTLKPGEVSGVVNSPQGKDIYKLVNIKSNVPPDFSTKKVQYVQDFVKVKVGRDVQNQIKDLLESGLLKWESTGYKALFDWYHISNDFTPSNTPAAQTTKFTQVIADAKKALNNNKGYDSRAAMLAWYASEDRLWSLAGPDKAKLRADRIEVLKAVTAETPYFSLKIELVDLLVDSKAGAEAGAALVDAATSNVTYDSVGQRNFQDINAKLTKLQTLKAVTPEQEKAIRAAQDLWVKQNQEIEEEKQKAKLAEAEAKKQDEELKAQQLAEAAKAKADQAKKNPTGTTGTAPKAPAAGAPSSAINPPAKKP